ncbi:FCS-Like Zinc finger 10-like isoform X2 [Primulina tabacum]
MLRKGRKGTRSYHKDENNGHLLSDADVLRLKHKNNSYFDVPGLFLEFKSKNSDSDSVRSPTSPLDFRVISGFGNPFRCLNSRNERQRKSWDCSKVGLSIIDSLDDEQKQSGKIIQSSDSKSILFGRQITGKSPNFCSHFDSLETIKSVPKNVDVFSNSGSKQASEQSLTSGVLSEIGKIPFGPFLGFRSFSLDSGRLGSLLSDSGCGKSNIGCSNLAAENATIPMSSECKFLEGSHELGDCSGGKSSPIPTLCSGTNFISSISGSEIELSEDYTCVRTHGSNPKVTHIYSDFILECHDENLTNFLKKSEDGKDDVTFCERAGNSNLLASYQAVDFLKFCYSCKKNLDGEDIFMYRGEKAFCSWICRSQEILIEEDMEIPDNNYPENATTQTNVSRLY